METLSRQEDMRVRTGQRWTVNPGQTDGISHGTSWGSLGWGSNRKGLEIEPGTYLHLEVKREEHLVKDTEGGQ